MNRASVRPLPPAAAAPCLQSSSSPLRCSPPPRWFALKRPPRQQPRIRSWPGRPASVHHRPVHAGAGHRARPSARACARSSPCATIARRRTRPCSSADGLNRYGSSTRASHAAESFSRRHAPVPPINVRIDPEDLRVQIDSEVRTEIAAAKEVARAYRDMHFSYDGEPYALVATRARNPESMEHGIQAATTRSRRRAKWSMDISSGSVTRASPILLTTPPSLPNWKP